MATYSLSVLDHIHRREGISFQDSFRDLMQMATAADRLGFKRLWFSEHHENPMYGSCAPEIAIPLIASQTRSIRVGSGGVMLSNYRPAKVAETFNLLSLLYPHRIDLGIGFASGSLPQFAERLKTSIVEDLSEKLRSLYAMGRGAAELTGNDAKAEAWILSSGSPETRDLAVEHRVGMVFAHFLNPHILAEAVLDFKGAYEARWQEKARIIVAMDVVTGSNRLAVRRNLQYRALHSILMKQNRNNVVFPASGNILNRCSGQELSDAITNMERSKMIGTFPEIAATFAHMAQEFGINEFMVHFYAPDPAERVAVLKGLAEAGALNEVKA